MDEKNNIYWELCKRNLDTRRSIILTTLTIVTAFGAWALQKWLIGEPIWTWNDHSTTTIIGTKLPYVQEKFCVVLFVYIISWSFYFLMILSLDGIIDMNMRKIARQLDLSASEVNDIKASMNPHAKYIPWILGTIIYILILLPLEPSSDGSQFKFTFDFSNLYAPDPAIMEHNP